MFKEGAKLSAIYLPDGAGSFGTGEYDVASIEVVLVCGQMSYVPWAKVSYAHAAPIMVNLAHADIVHMALGEEDKMEVV